MLQLYLLIYIYINSLAGCDSIVAQIILSYTDILVNGRQSYFPE